MGENKYIAYVRVSTEKQGRSGLGLEAQKAIIRQNAGEENIIAWYEEIQTGKNLDNLPQLNIAKNRAKAEGCILIVAKTDRLRNTQQALDLVDELTPEGVFFCNIGRTADKFMLTLFFAFAEKERLEISIRTKAALAALKAKGVKLGRYAHRDENKENARLKEISKLGNEAMRLKSINNIRNLKAFSVATHLGMEGMTYSNIAAHLNENGYVTPNEKKWRAGGIYRLLRRFSKWKGIFS